jgi:hypothetical protein
VRASTTSSFHTSRNAEENNWLDNIKENNMTIGEKMTKYFERTKNFMMTREAKVGRQSEKRNIIHKV